MAIKSAWLLEPKKSGISVAWAAPILGVEAPFKYPYVPHKLRIMSEEVPLTVRIGRLSLGGYLNDKASWCLKHTVTQNSGYPFEFWTEQDGGNEEAIK